MMNLRWPNGDVVTEREFRAMEKALNSIDMHCHYNRKTGKYDMDLELIQEDINNSYLTSNKCRNGREVIWYLDEANESCVYIDTLEELSDKEIENELC